MHLQVLPPVANRTGPNLDWYYVSILNKIKWALLFGGERVLWYQRRTMGERCPHWDPIRQQHAIDTDYPDDKCYGVGYVGGYYRPVEIFVSLASAVQKQIVVQEEGQKVFYSPKSWSLHEPNFRNGDVLVRKNGERYWLANVTPTMWRSKILRYMFDLDRIEPSHPVYNIPV